jgi:hypothetical protein
LLIFIPRIVYAFGGRIKYAITEITQTYLSVGVLDLIKEADYLARKILRESGMLILLLYCHDGLSILSSCVQLFSLNRSTLCEKFPVTEGGQFRNDRTTK